MTSRSALLLIDDERGEADGHTDEHRRQHEKAHERSYVEAEILRRYAEPRRELPRARPRRAAAAAAAALSRLALSEDADDVTLAQHAARLPMGSIVRLHSRLETP